MSPLCKCGHRPESHTGMAIFPLCEGKFIEPLPNYTSPYGTNPYGWVRRDPTTACECGGYEDA